MGASTVFDPESKSEGQIRALLNRFNARKHQRHSDFGLGFTSDFGFRPSDFGRAYERQSSRRALAALLSNGQRHLPGSGEIIQQIANLLIRQRR